MSHLCNPIPQLLEPSLCIPAPSVSVVSVPSLKLRTSGKQALCNPKEFSKGVGHIRNPNRVVQPFGISGPHWKKKSCLGTHIKYIATLNHKKISACFKYLCNFVLGRIHNHPEPRAAGWTPLPREMFVSLISNLTYSLVIMNLIRLLFSCYSLYNFSSLGPKHIPRSSRSDSEAGHS